MSKPSSKLNEPERYKLFILDEEAGEKKLSVVEDSKIPNAATITINKEDHTLANMLRSQLLLLPPVIFCGYKVPHPLEPLCILKIQTDGSITPVLALEEAVRQLIVLLSKTKDSFGNEVLKMRATMEDDDDDHDEGMGDEI